MAEHAPLSPADLPIVAGRAYHLDLAPDELARDVIIVGDPERVPLLADHCLAGREVDRSHRGFRTITGIARETGLRVSLVTSGIGTPSLEIVLNELVALNEIDFASRGRKGRFEPLTVVRIGTCGGLRPETPLGTLVVTDYVVGLDNTGLFYDIPAPDHACQELEERFRAAIDRVTPATARFRGRLFPYAARSHPEVAGALAREAAALGIPCTRGLTVSSASFFAGEGRRVSRAAVTVPDLDALLAAAETGIAGVKLESVEMEASFLLHFLGGIGYRAGVICAIIDKRQEGTFMADYREQLRGAAQITLRAFRALRGVR